MNTQRTLGIKRSFHCGDLSSIVDLNKYNIQAEDDGVAEQSRKRVKRQRAISMDGGSPSCSATCSCCGEEEEVGKGLMSLSSVKFMPTTTTSSTVRLISPATSHVTVNSHHSAANATQEFAPVSSNDAVSSLPNFPSLRSARNESSDFPATAALERYMLKQRRSPTPSEDDVSDQDFATSFEDDRGDEETSDCWTNFDQEEGLTSPRHVEDFPWITRRVSMTSRKSSSASVHESSVKSNDSVPHSLLPMASACKLLPFKNVPHQRPDTTVLQLTEALAKM